MSELSSLSELARFVGQSSLASENAQIHSQAVNAMVARFNPSLKRRSVTELLAVINGQQLNTVFQPIVDLRHASLFGYEALTRGRALEEM